MRQYKRILAAIGSAVLLISNLGAVTQTVFAVEQPQIEDVASGPGTDKPPEQTENDTSSEAEIDIQSVSGEETPPADQTGDTAGQTSGQESAGGGTSGETGEGSHAESTSQGETSTAQGQTGANSNTSSDTVTATDTSQGSDTQSGDQGAGVAGQSTDGNQAGSADHAGDESDTAGTANGSAQDGMAGGSTEGTGKDGTAGESTEEPGKETGTEDSGDESDEDDELTEAYEAETSGITVHADTSEDAFTEPVTLVASRIRDGDTLDGVMTMLDESDVTYDGYVALDVHFENDAGDEVEPSGAVKVSFELEQDIVPTEADPQSLEIQHFDESKDTTDIVTVADTTGGEDRGTITVNSEPAMATEDTDSDEDLQAAFTAEFTVRSFSTFTITWRKTNGTQTTDTTSLRVVCKDMNGDLLVDAKVPEDITLESGVAQSFASGSTGFDNLNIDKDSTLTLNYVEAVIATYADGATTATKTSYKVDSITATYNEDTTKWTYSITGYLEGEDGNPADEQITVSNIPEGDLTLVLYYNATGITLRFDANGGTADTELNDISGQPSSKVHIPSSYTVTRSGYSFLGWMLPGSDGNKSVVIGGNRENYRSVYPANSDYRLPESATKDTVTLYAVWSDNTSHNARFFIRFGSSIPAEPDSASADAYTDNKDDCQVNETITKQQWIIDTDTRTRSSGSDTYDRVDYEGYKGSSESGTKINFVPGVYIKSDVYNQLDALLNISTLCDLINNKSGSTGYEVSYSSENKKLTISKITNRSLAGDREPGEQLFILWYVQKPANYNDLGYWNVDGILVRASEVSITYDGNETADCNRDTVPTGYSTSPGTVVRIGASGSATSDNILTPTRTGYEFIEWNDKADGSGTGYRPWGSGAGAKHTELKLTENTILYAIWSKLPRGSLEITKNVGGDTEYIANLNAVYDINLTVKRAAESSIENYDKTIKLATGEHPAMLYNADGTAATEDAYGKSLTTAKFQYDTTTSFQYNTTVTFKKAGGETDGEDERSEATVRLKDGQRIVIYSLYDNAIFTVTESEESARGFNVIYSGYDPDHPSENRLESNATTTVGITNRKRVVKTGVDVGGTTPAAMVALIAAGILGTTAYHKARRYMR